MSKTPTLKVEIAFTYDPVDTTPTWTDVSAYVREGNLQRGRSSELDQFTAGSCEIVLDNRDRRFDPLNTSSPYAPYILPRCQVRVTATYAAVDYPMFRGFVTSWPQDRDVGNRDATARMQCVDGLAYLSAQKLEGDIYSSYLRALDAQAVWPLGNGGTTQLETETQSNFTLTADLTNSDLACATHLAGNPTTFDTVNFGLAGTGVTTAGAFSLICFMRSNLAGPRGILAGSGGNRLIVDDFGLPHYYGDSASAEAFGNATVIDGANHMVVVTHDATSGVTAPTVYRDGVDVTGAGAVAGASGAQLWNILGTYSAGTPLVGPLQQVALVSRVLTASEVAFLYYAAESAWVGATTHLQVSTLLDVAGWPATGGTTYDNDWRSISQQSISTLDFIDAGNSTALDVIQQIVASEQGQFFVNGSGKTVLLCAWDLYDTANHARNAVSQFTFSDLGTAGTVGYTNSGFDLDDAFLVNTVIAKTSDGSPTYTKNLLSQYAFGPKTYEIQTRLRTVLEAQNLGLARIARYAVPQPRLRSFEVLPQGNPAVEFPKMLNLELQDRVTVVARPLNTGTTHTQDYWIEALSHTFSPGSWSCQVNASQVPGAGYWDLETDGFDGTSTRLQ